MSARSCRLQASPSCSLCSPLPSNNKATSVSPLSAGERGLWWELHTLAPPLLPPLQGTVGAKSLPPHH